MKTEINGIGIDYSDEGTGLPIIFIHAFPLNRTMWSDQAAALRSRFRVITPDLRGFGKSDAPAGPYSMDQMASDVRALIEALSIKSAVIVGCSMGGYVAFAFYRNYPEAASALVLVDTRAGQDAPEARDRREKSAEKAEREGARAIADDMTSMLLGSTTEATRPEIVQRVRAMTEANSPRGIAAAQRGMAARFDSTSLLSQITCPALVVAGTEDKLGGRAEAEAMASRIPGARLQVIESAGHLPNLERPEEFNKALIDFLETLPG